MAGGRALSSKCQMGLFTILVAETTLVSFAHVCNHDLAFETTNFFFIDWSHLTALHIVSRCVKDENILPEILVVSA